MLWALFCGVCPAQYSSIGQKTSSTGAQATAAASKSANFNFVDIAESAGLNVEPTSSSRRQYIVETMGGGGIAFFDCDNDGKLDIAVVNDSTIARYKAGGDPMVTLYRQDGSRDRLHFSDATNSSGMTTRGWGMGLAAADFDNDGWTDLYVTGYGHNVLYKNLGACKFQDVTAKAGVAVGGFSTGAAWADYDRDGKLDLFVARYVSVDVSHLPPPNPRAVGYRRVILQMPDALEGESDFLFRNRGDGTFEDVSLKAGVSDPQRRRGMGVTWGDYDGDGWPDLYVTNDSGINQLYHNKQDGAFEEVGILSGAGPGPHGESLGNMAADFGDFDRDGRLDIFVTRYGDQPASLYRNSGKDFTDVAVDARIARITFVPVKWGTGFGDFDNDGWLDIFIADGSFSSEIDTLDVEAKYREPVQLLRNLGDNTFAEVADSSGLNRGPLQSRRGSAFGDVNNDGRLDIAVFNAASPPSLFVNHTLNSNHRVVFHLVGTKSNRSAVGSRVTVRTGNVVQIQEVRAGGSYLSTSDTRLHFGLGDNQSIDIVEVHWPSGLRQEFRNISGDAIYDVVEGQEPKRALAFSGLRD